MRYNAILFDMDGVLIESEELMRASAIRSLAEHGVQAKHEDFMNSPVAEKTALSAAWQKNTALSMIHP